MRRRSARTWKSKAVKAALRRQPKRSAVGRRIICWTPTGVSSSVIARSTACRSRTCCSTTISMQALVLAAGLGTRLRPLTDVCAKPAIPVAGEPLIRRIVRWLAAHDVNEVVVNLHHLPETVAAVLGDGSDLSVRVRYSWEQPQILGS